MTATLPLAGCATKAPQRQRAPARAPVTAPQPLQTVSPATYVTQAASIDLFVLRSSELALVRAQNLQIRDFASRVIAAHHGTASQLSLAGRRLNLLPPATMIPQHQLMYSELAAASSFDGTYLRLQRAVHGAALSLHADYARRGTSPTLKPVAANAAAVERSHIEMLRRL